VQPMVWQQSVITIDKLGFLASVYLQL